MRARRIRTSAVASALALVGLVAACTPPAASPSTGGGGSTGQNGQTGQARTVYPVASQFSDALLPTILDPTGPPPGANDWSCRPGAAHPRPVVLVHGTAANMSDSWRAVAPTLANAGYCVFALNYGGEVPDAFFGGMQAMERSSLAEIGPFIDRVLAATGARQVDLVGHSQGTVAPRWWMRFGDSTWADGTPKVHTLVGLGPVSHGTNFYGLLPFVSAFPALSAGLSSVCGSCVEFAEGSPFLETLANPAVLPGERFAGELQPGVRYVMIATRYDNFITPYTDGFLTPGPAVENVLVQDACRLDFSDHLGLVYDPVTLALVGNALDPDHPVMPPCFFVAPVFAINWYA